MRYALSPLLACCITTAASAQTTVVLYGIADGNVRFDHTAIGTLKSVGSGGESASRWGLRGTEDLGGGMKAIFNVEQDLDLSDNSAPLGNISGTSPTSPVSSTGSRLFGRRSVVGLSSATFGEIRIGRDYTPLYTAWATADPFGAGTVSRATNYAVGSATRYDNAVSYDSPAFHGVKAKLQYRRGESTSNAPLTGGLLIGQAWSASLTYTQGRWYLAAGFLQERNADVITRKAATASATCDFTVVKLHALGFYSQDFAGRRYAYALGVSVPIQAFRLFGVAARIDNKQDQFAGLTGAGDANFFGLGGNYALSRRTDLYAAGAKVLNGTGSNYVLGDNSNNGLFNAGNVPAGFHPWSIQAGVRHLF